MSSTNYYHIMVRGINKEEVFCTKQHKRVFLKYMHQQLDHEDVHLLAWCIMWNHAHLVVNADLSNLSKFIKIVFYMEYFINNKDRYISFHKEDQVADYFIDVKEHTVLGQEELLWSIVQTFNQEHSIQDLNEYQIRKKLYNELIYNIYQNTDLSMSRIASC